MSHTEKIKKQSIAFLEGTHNHIRTPWLLLFGTSFLIAVLLFPNLLVTTPRYRTGDVVQKDIKSPKDFLIEDKQATQRKREEAARSILTIYDLDDTLSAELANRITQAFEYMRNLFSAGEPNAIAQKQPSHKAKAQGGAPLAQTVSRHDLIWKEKQNLEKMIGIEISNRAYKILEKENFSDSIAKQINQLLQAVLQNGIVANKQLLLQERDKGIVVRRLSSKEEVSVNNLQKFYSLDEAKTAIAKTGRKVLKDVDYTLRNMVIDTAQHLIQPNLTLNKGETEERKKKAVAEVKAVLTQVKQGEMLLREGEKVTEADRLKLQALESETRRGQVFTSSVGFMLLAMVFFIISFNVIFKVDGTLTLDNKDLLFLCLMLIILFFLSEVSASLANGIAGSIPYSIEASSLFYAIPVATGPMTVCLLMGLRIGLPFSVAMAFVVAFLFENPFEMLLFFLLSGIVGTYWVRICKERGTLIKAGLKVGLVNILVVTALHMFNGAGLELKLFGDWTFSFVGGVSSGILATGLAPMVEMMFGYTTDIKLLELANLDRPLLRKLMLEAPGTYHHCVIVGSLVEAAATAIGANPLLAKVSGYYHDIGKIKKPLYFIENQVGGENRHDKLAPSMSSLILVAHVKDGAEIARNHRLGKAIIDIIQQHHGTSLITYFYEKAKQLKGEDAVNMEHFRYPGPKPQTKEAGLVLLADAVEAVSRTLENPTPARIEGLVQKIINKIFLDGQLDECELTLKDLHEIARSFNQILNGIHHHRIEYPEGDTKVNGGEKKLNGNSDRRQARSLQARPRGNKEEGKNNLKRLGMLS
ncbi:MAG: HD family phosphohydrolase [Deltaproteobacteria bacterium]|nr:MAG: HD family phosphohydrolase [Deltaproteobacteria bacterium]